MIALLLGFNLTVLPAAGLLPLVAFAATDKTLRRFGRNCKRPRPLMLMMLPEPTRFEMILSVALIPREVARLVNPVRAATSLIRSALFITQVVSGRWSGVRDH